ncbi:MAG: hypothetical protein IJ025_00370 [Clostridia bacterium]|nr:hypothetical protein [Clostridia bacterium]
MNNRVLFGIMCILFNQVGVPCFMQGQTSTGIKRIVFLIISCGVIGFINVIKGIILGVKILKMTDEEYEEGKGTFSAGIPL